MDCPGGYAHAAPSEGLNEGFTSADQSRSFHLLTSTDGATGPKPLFVALTGTVQEERSFLAQSQFDLLVDDGWIVVAPVRNDNGILWPPWDAMSTPRSPTIPNPDLDFVVDLVGCIAAHTEVDANRIFVGGISIGGTMTNYVLQRERAVRRRHRRVRELRHHRARRTRASRRHDRDRRLGRRERRLVGLYRRRDGRRRGRAGATTAWPESRSSTMRRGLRSSMPARPTCNRSACSMELGHIWITPATEYMAAVLLAHPKGMPGDYTLPIDPPAPPDLSCSTEPFVLEGVSLDG